ncbi:Ankyrin repeat domain-containing protein [Plasmodiophora brassicae]
MSIGDRTRFSTCRWLCVITSAALLSGLGGAAPSRVTLISADGVRIDAVAAAIRGHSETLKDLLDRRSARNDHTSPIVLKAIASPELRAVVKFSEEYALDEDEAGAKWVGKMLNRTRGQHGYYALLTAAGRLRMPTLGRALLSLKADWVDIPAMIKLLPRKSEALLFMVENCPVVAGIRRYIATQEIATQVQQTRIVDKIPRAAAFGEQGSVTIVNNEPWNDLYDNVLQWASSAGNVRLVELLADVPGIDANLASPDNRHTTALHWAAFNGYDAVVKALLTIPGINVNAISSYKSRTPLHVAALWGRHKVVDVLLGDDRIQVDVRDDKGRTPLMLAASYGHFKVVKSVLSGVKPIKVDAVDRHKRTALDWAEASRHPHPEIVSLLAAVSRGGALKKLGAVVHRLRKKVT